jgi:hypothetical protein
MKLAATCRSSSEKAKRLPKDGNESSSDGVTSCGVVSGDRGGHECFLFESPLGNRWFERKIGEP